MPTVTESIGKFLKARAIDANRDLIDRWTPAMETQVNVRAGNGEPVEGRRNTWTDGHSTWHHVRMPKNADTEPAWSDYQIGFPLDLHAEGIGCTGWDWQARLSRWVGFDFDSITSHAKGAGIEDAALEQIKEAVSALPYVEVRHSTGGAGLHLYVYVDGVPTANHTEHAALARCILGMMSSAAGFDFASQIDCCGHVMWVWARKMSAENRGLEIIKQATQVLSVADLPVNWKDHVEVVTRRRAKLRIGALKDEYEDPFEALANSRRLVPLDDSHKAVIEELTHSGFSAVWVPDYHLLQTHTKALQNLLERTELGIKGVFKTISEGRHPETCNCFCFPLDKGAWRVYRFSPGVPEAESWTQDTSGWTNCYFNKPVTLELAAKLVGGQEAPNNKGFSFPTTEKAQEALELLGQDVAFPQEIQGRPARLRPQKDGKVAISVKKEKGESAPNGWLDGRGHFERLLDGRIEVKNQSAQDQGIEFDKLIRTLVTPNNQGAGWLIKNQEATWNERSKDDARSVLATMGVPKAELDSTLGAACLRPWKLVTIPFQPEYPGNRQWNRNAAQYTCAPTEGEHPHWDMLLKHSFSDLDAAIKADPVAQKMGIRTGADYGLLWTAYAIREPYKKLPYLFFYGGSDCGKSTYPEAFEFLMTKGLVKANAALRSQGDFNGELAGAIVAVIEEIDLLHVKGALSKLKDWVTGEWLLVRKMRTDAYEIRSTLHFIQVANESSFCPIFPDDTRITMIFVPPLFDRMVPRDHMRDYLKEEAPHFLWTLLNTKLPPPESRLRLPVIATDRKVRAQNSNRSQLEEFISDHAHHVPGAKVPFSEFYERFHGWLSEDEKERWTKRRVTKELPDWLPQGVLSGNVKFIGNLSLEDGAVPDKPWTVHDGRLCQ
jgi:hypothetical protein